MGTPVSNHSIGSWDYESRDRLIEIKIRRNTFIAFFVSLVIHGIVLFAFSPKRLIEAASVANLPPTTLSVRLAGLPSKKPLAEISHRPIKPKNPSLKSNKALPTHPVIAMEKEAIIASPQPIFKPPVAAENNAPTDLMSYIRAKKQRAQESEDNAARENAAASANARGPSADELRDANIRRNLQQQGTSGIFDIRHKTLERAQFSFRGWKNDYYNSRLELIDVEVGPDGNIDLAIVKKMIEIIRREYNGDFNWESQRLGRVVVLSARIEDNTGLEEFLMREFFAAQGYYSRP